MDRAEKHPIEDSNIPRNCKHDDNQRLKTEKVPEDEEEVVEEDEVNVGVSCRSVLND